MNDTPINIDSLRKTLIIEHARVDDAYREVIASSTSPHSELSDHISRLEARQDNLLDHIKKQDRRIRELERYTGRLHV